MTALPMSLEARARIIADASTQAQHAGNPQARRDAVEKIALEQLRAVNAGKHQASFYSAEG